MEQITKTKTMLYIWLVDYGTSDCSETKGYFQQAAEQGRVEMK